MFMYAYVSSLCLLIIVKISSLGFIILKFIMWEHNYQEFGIIDRGPEDDEYKRKQCVVCL